MNTGRWWSRRLWSMHKNASHYRGRGHFGSERAASQSLPSSQESASCKHNACIQWMWQQQDRHFHAQVRKHVANLCDSMLNELPGHLSVQQLYRYVHYESFYGGFNMGALATRWNVCHGWSKMETFKWDGFGRNRELQLGVMVVKGFVFQICMVLCSVWEWAI